jgi:hypothetical protein
VWLAAGGSEPGWRQAELEVSFDGGASYAPIGIASGAAVIGTAATVLPPGPTERWDRGSQVEVQLSNTSLWLESRTETGVLAGANLALLGNELIQFSAAEAISPGRFRLEGLLRGRRGTEASVASHTAGERFVLLDPARLIAFDAPLDAVGQTLRFRATGRDDPPGGTAAQVDLRGAALRPLSPVHARARIAPDGSAAVRWTRRSRAGFGGPDGTDAPLAEEVEAWLVELLLGGTALRSVTLAAPQWTYTAADRSADGMAGACAVSVTIRQVSAAVGPGEPARLALTLPQL